MVSITKNIEIEFTDEKITASGGSIFLAAMAERLGLADRLRKAIRIKRRNRGASDVEILLSLIYSLAQGDGAILDVDRLAEDEARLKLLGLERVPGHATGQSETIISPIHLHTGKQG